MQKIKMTTPLVELDGDEMTRIIWQKIKDKLLLPHIDLRTEYYDLGLENREKTKDQVTIDSANAIKKYGVGVKCPQSPQTQDRGIQPFKDVGPQRHKGDIDEQSFSPDEQGIKVYIPTWTKPITIARHAYGDVYSGVEAYTNTQGKAEIIMPDGSKKTICNFDGAGIVQAMHNKDESIKSFARSCMNYALDTKQDLWFATKDTISKIYDHRFKDIFQEIYESEYKEKFEKAGIEYFYTLIDDAVARVVRSNGGFIWACKNYDGDVMSDMVATVFGSLAMMTSVLVSPKGYYEYEAAHGTVTRHYYNHLKGQVTSTNPMATIFAWTGALRKRGELDGLKDLMEFANKLERASVQTIEEGFMTKDLISLFESDVEPKAATTDEF